MPALLFPSVATVFDSADSLPQNVWSAFKSDPLHSNIIYSHALKATHDSDQVTDDQVWIVCTTDDKLDFVLSCTHHAMGTYPVFLYSAHPTRELIPAFVLPRIQLLVDKLRESVDVERVYSVFAVDVVTRAFSEMWSKATQIRCYKEPYYAAKFTFCTRQSFKARQYTTFPGISYELRLAVPSDIRAAAKLCYGFAAAAKPFVLTKEEAIEEATLLVSREQLWVHSIQDGNCTPEIASIVAVTRESASVAAITKVFTNPDWRSRRCAERLVRKVTQSRKENVVLYVAHDNPAASKVYNRVGFVGLDESSLSVDGVESWLELGFDRNKVQLGHW
ncbi:hypothetical protein DXG01_009922 [Tephrocybe rancida]|nr:hypothetical protein DXG01_009922 [Tephrocybe rancida]